MNLAVFAGAGGKYVGFGSTPPPSHNTGSGGVDDVTAMLSKGFSGLSSLASELAPKPISYLPRLFVSYRSCPEGFAFVCFVPNHPCLALPGKQINPVLWV